MQRKLFGALLLTRSVVPTNIKTPTQIIKDSITHPEGNGSLWRAEMKAGDTNRRENGVEKKWAEKMQRS